ncbi:hypothetical protein SAMN05444396_10648 [Flavobacterium segetis]|uniref:Glycosyl transferase family 8 n=1 Tax=Flavobacterium segetis TaxID=271157 RepID=A0A1M5I0S0_9FLAO|nr:hypothetical protein [Flavobacterium segetis]SHG21742.1 hypothetical protein SAMN05444396_10648 [Flavobacterium segetis]
MGKLPGLSRITKKITCKIASKNRRHFGHLIESKFSFIIKEINCQKNIDMEVVSFSSNNDYNEQLLSILSFLRYIGKPIKWTIYSDGSHTEMQKKQIRNDTDFVTIKSIKWEEILSLKELCNVDLQPYHNYILDYAKKHAFGKRLFYYLNHSIDCPTLFIDSDILFYEKANLFDILLSEEPKVNGWYMPDIEWGCLDSRYKAIYSQQTYQVNAGLMLVFKKFDHYKKSLDFYKVLNGKYEYFSEQTIINILLKDNYFMPLSAKIFILDNKDQFDFSHLYNPKQIAIRHYTGPVRHKMWQKDYRWHLSL